MSMPLDVFLHMLLSGGEDTGSKFYLRPPRIPSNVVTGCKPKTVVLDNRGQPATRRDGTQILRQTKRGGKPVLAIDYRGVPNRVFQDRVNYLRRMAAGRYVGPFPTHGKKSRLAREAADVRA